MSLVFSEADAPDWDGVTPETRLGTERIWSVLSGLGVKGEITSGKRNKADNSWHNLGGAADIWLGDENGNRLEHTDPRVAQILSKAKSDGWEEVLYHDAGSGYHLHLGNYTKKASTPPDGSYSLEGAFDRQADPFGARPPIIPSREPERNTFMSRWGDRFAHNWYDSGPGGILRNIWADVDTMNLSGDAYKDWKPTQDDLDYVTKALPGDVEAQRWVLASSSNPYHLAKLVTMKVEDTDRRDRIESFRDGWRVNLPYFGETNISLQAITANVAGSLLSDPTNLIPLGQSAILAKSLGRLGKVGRTLSMSKLFRYSEIAATNAAVNVAERKFAEVGGGFSQDYTAAAIIGGIAGGGLRMVGDFLDNRTAAKLIGSLDNAETHAIAHASGAELPNAVPKIREALMKLHDVDAVNGLKSSTLSKLSQDGKVAVVGRNELVDAMREAGITLPDNVRAFHKADEGLTVLVKDALTSDTKIDNLLAHEIGVHANLRETFGDRGYSEIQAAVERRMKKPNKEWLAAMKAVPEGGWEEVLGHWIERANPNDSLVKKLSNGVNNGLKKLGAIEGLTDGELKDFVKRSVQNATENQRGFRTLPDGTVELGGLRYSAGNVMNPHVMDTVLNLENVRQTGVANAVSDWTESGWFYGTPFGTLTRSASPTLRNYSSNALHDYRMRGFKGNMVMPVERMKDHIKRQLDENLENYYAIRKEHLGGLQQFDSSYQHDFNRQVRECFNATYTDNTAGLVSRKWDPAVSQGAAEIKRLRDRIVEIGKKSSDMFGSGRKNMIEADWKALDDELWRVLDDDKWVGFINKFPTVQQAKEWLEEYGVKTAKRDKIEQKIMDEKTKVYEIELDKAKKNNQPAPAKPTVTPDEVEARIKEDAKSWANGISDRNLSNLDHSDKAVLGDPQLFHERFPMDTSMVVKTPWGEDFSYDISLRSDEFDRFIPKIINRFAGESALRNLFDGDPGALQKLRDKATSELDQAIAHKIPGYNEARKQRELLALDRSLNEIRGVRKPDDIRGNMEALVTTAKGLSYAQNGANMGLNQIGEISGSLAYIGGKAVFHFIPELADTIRALKHGKEAAEIVKDAERHLFGSNLELKLFQTDLKSRVWKEAQTRESLAKLGDKANTLVNYASQLVGKVSMMPKLTDRMLRGARTDAIMDTLEWAGGKQFGPLRNPFSDKKLAAAGIDKQMADTIKTDLNAYTTRDGSGKVVSFDMEKWEATSPTSYYKWRFLVDNQGLRAIQQTTAGNSNILKDSSLTGKIVFQFKDFSMRAMNGQLGRVLTNREMDDCLSLLFSMGTNMAVYAGITYGRSYAYFGNDPGKRQDYLDSRLAPEELAKAAFLRSMVGTSLSFVQDLYEATTGSQSFRTTVDRTAQFGRQKKERTLSDAVGDAVVQFPAIRAAKSVVYDTPHAAYKALFTEKLAQRDLKDVVKTIPLQNFLPLVYFTNLMTEESGLPRK